MSGAHRFRFFVAETGTSGASVPLADVDVQHVRVLRLQDGSAVDVVDADGRVWDARIRGDRATLERELAASAEPSGIAVIAGALTGARFDELVDGVVQAGATQVTPLALTRRDHDRLAARRARLERIARAAAKQSKRRVVPQVLAPIAPDELPSRGIVLDAAAPTPLDEVIRSSAGDEEIRMLVGGADGLPDALVQRLVHDGWSRGRLGPTILRAELAAPVAVAIAAMHAPTR